MLTTPCHRRVNNTVHDTNMQVNAPTRPRTQDNGRQVLGADRLELFDLVFDVGLGAVPGV